MTGNVSAPILELFAGIGGVAEACAGTREVIAAVDINANARSIYQSNFAHAYLVRSVESISHDLWDQWQSCAWWLSAPCQPFTRRGKQLDRDDPRSFALKKVMTAIRQYQPPQLFLENVTGFRNSQMRSGLVNLLKELGYSLAEYEVCPSQLGIPNKRPRYYLRAVLKSGRLPSFAGLSKLELQSRPKPLQAYLDPPGTYDDNTKIWLDESVANRFAAGLNVVSRDGAETVCFTSAYGKSVMHCGSYLREPDGRIRRFAPAEIARLLGYSDSFAESLRPERTDLTLRQLWKLIGNSISIPVVRRILLDQ